MLRVSHLILIPLRSIAFHRHFSSFNITRKTIFSSFVSARQNKKINWIRREKCSYYFLLCSRCFIVIVDSSEFIDIHNATMCVDGVTTSMERRLCKSSQNFNKLHPLDNALTKSLIASTSANIITIRPWFLFLTTFFEWGEVRNFDVFLSQHDIEIREERK